MTNTWENIFPILSLKCNIVTITNIHNMSNNKVNILDDMNDVPFFIIFFSLLLKTNTLLVK